MTVDFTKNRTAPTEFHSQNSSHQVLKPLGEVELNKNEVRTEPVETLQDYLCLENIGTESSKLRPGMGTVCLDRKESKASGTEEKKDIGLERNIFRKFDQNF